MKYKIIFIALTLILIAQAVGVKDCTALEQTSSTPEQFKQAAECFAKYKFTENCSKNADQAIKLLGIIQAPVTGEYYETLASCYAGSSQASDRSVCKIYYQRAAQAYHSELAYEKSGDAYKAVAGCMQSTDKTRSTFFYSCAGEYLTAYLQNESKQLTAIPGAIDCYSGISRADPHIAFLTQYMEALQGISANITVSDYNLTKLAQKPDTAVPLLKIGVTEPPKDGGKPFEIDASLLNLLIYISIAVVIIILIVLFIYYSRFRMLKPEEEMVIIKKPPAPQAPAKPAVTPVPVAEKKPLFGFMRKKEADDKSAKLKAAIEKMPKPEDRAAKLKAAMEKPKEKKSLFSFFKKKQPIIKKEETMTTADVLKKKEEARKERKPLFSFMRKKEKPADDKSKKLQAALSAAPKADDRSAKLKMAFEQQPKKEKKPLFGFLRKKEPTAKKEEDILTSTTDFLKKKEEEKVKKKGFSLFGKKEDRADKLKKELKL